MKMLEHMNMACNTQKSYNVFIKEQKKIERSGRN